ncbi:hypothetical protein ES705_16847 [subsurface metagenome]
MKEKEDKNLFFKSEFVPKELPENPEEDQKKEEKIPFFKPEPEDPIIPWELPADQEEKKISIKRKRPPFTIIENAIIQDKNISKHAMMVYLVLCMHADKNGKDSYPGLKTIERESRSGHTTVIDAIKELVNAGYVIKEQRRNPKKPDGYLSNLYTITGKRKEGTPNQEGGTPNQEGGVLPDETDNNIPSFNIDPINNNNKEEVVVEFHSQKNGDIFFSQKEVLKFCNETTGSKEAVISSLEFIFKRMESLKDPRYNPKGWMRTALIENWDLEIEQREEEWEKEKERENSEAKEFAEMIDLHPERELDEQSKDKLKSFNRLLFQFDGDKELVPKLQEMIILIQSGANIESQTKKYIDEIEPLLIAKKNELRKPTMKSNITSPEAQEFIKMADKIVCKNSVGEIIQEEDTIRKTELNKQRETILTEKKKELVII